MRRGFDMGLELNTDPKERLAMSKEGMYSINWRQSKATETRDGMLCGSKEENAFLSRLLSSGMEIMYNRDRNRGSSVTTKEL